MRQRRQGRELALQMLFQSDMAKQSVDEVRKTFWTERTNVNEETRGFADDLFRVAFERRSEIDKLIEKHAAHWRVGAHGSDRSQSAAYGGSGVSAVSERSDSVVINEALEMAHKYSAPESVNFLNGVLDSLAKELGRPA